MKANGTAMQSDVDIVEAQYLSVRQQITQTESAAHTYRTLLGLYTGKDMTDTPLVKPQPVIPDVLTPARPELNLFAAQTQSNDARSGNIRADVMPRIGLFAQAYYGYPGFNYFENMEHQLILHEEEQPAETAPGQREYPGRPRGVSVQHSPADTVAERTHHRA